MLYLPGFYICKTALVWNGESRSDGMLRADLGQAEGGGDEGQGNGPIEEENVEPQPTTVVPHEGVFNNYVQDIFDQVSNRPVILLVSRVGGHGLHGHLYSSHK